MLNLMKNSVSIANTKAWITPTNISNPISGTGRMYGKKKLATKIKTSPAKMFPKRRNEKEISRPRLLMISRIPTKNPTNDLKFKYFPAYFPAPSTAMPVISIVKKEMKASARVKFKSAVA
jgi:hypothetical protein